MSILSAQGVNKSYSGHLAIKDLSLEIAHGSIFGLLGPNGAGKTSFIRIINQITAPDSGKILFDGKPLSPEHIYQIGYLPEERGLYKKMKVGEQALYLAQLKGLSKKEATKRLKYWFEKFEIQAWWDKKIEELSKGMAQKVQFITTVLHEPKLLIFDEPFSGFDPINANLIKREIMELRDKGATIIFSTHRMESVEEICDHIALMNKSEKVLDGNLKAVKQQFKTNTFKLHLASADVNFQLNSGEVVSHAHLEDGLKEFVVKLNDATNMNALLQEMISVGEVHHFEEVIPTVNDIFIQEVSAHKNQA